MLTTIGELTNGLMPYCNVIEMSIVNHVPFIRALLGSGSGFTKAYVYIVQTEEHRYSVCDSYDDTGGNRFFPTGNNKYPFIQEKDIICMKFSTKDPEGYGDYSSLVNDLTESSFFDHLYDLLFTYDIITVDPKIFSTPLSHIFTNPRIRRNIEAGFKYMNCHGSSVGDFVNNVIRKGNKFNLGNLRSREVKEVTSKLKSIGIVPTLEGNIIIQASLDRHK